MPAKRYIPIILISLFLANGYAANTLPDNLKITKNILAYQDKLSLSVEQIIYKLKNGEFEKLGEGVPNLGYQSKPYWFFIDLKKIKIPSNGFIQIKYPLSEVDLIAVRDGKVVESMKGGERSAFHLRPFLYRDISFEITETMETADGLLFRVKSSTSYIFPLHIWKKYDLVQHVIYETYFLASYLGSLLVFFVLSLISLTYFRDAANLTYCLFLFSYIIFQFGLSNMTFFIKSFSLRELEVAFFGPISFFLISIHSYYSVRKFPKWVVAITSGVSIFALSSACFSNYASAVNTMVMLQLVFAAILFICGIVLWIKGIETAKFYSISWTFYFIGIILLCLKTVGVLPHNAITTHTFKIAIWFQVLFLTLNIVLKYKRVQEDKVKAEKQASRVKTIVNMTQLVAHDVRKPFGLLENIINMIQAENSSEKIKKMASVYLPKVQENLTSVDGMLDDIMEIDRSTPHTLKPVDIHEILSSALNEISSVSANQEIEIRYVLKHNHMANGNFLKLKRIFINIIENAIEAMPTSGKLWIHTHESANEDHLTCCIGNAPSYIPQDELTKIFDPFYSKGKSKGTGLGLTIAQKNIKAHGGKIWCHSDKKKEQVEFYFTLLKTNVLASQFTNDLPEKIYIDPESAYRRMQEIGINDLVPTDKEWIEEIGPILFVEDNAVIRNAWIHFLGEEKIKVFEHPESLLLEVEENGEILDKASAVITDNYFASLSKTTGFDLAKELKNLGFKKPIFLASSVDFSHEASFAHLFKMQIKKKPIAALEQIKGMIT